MTYEAPQSCFYSYFFLNKLLKSIQCGKVVLLTENQTVCTDICRLPNSKIQNLAIRPELIKRVHPSPLGNHIKNKPLKIKFDQILSLKLT